MEKRSIIKSKKYVIQIMLFIVFLFAPNFLLCYSNKADSLLNELNRQSDVYKKNILLSDCGYEISQANNETGLYILDSALNIAQKLNYSEGIAHNYKLHAYYYLNKDFKKALDYFLLSKEYYINTNDYATLFKINEFISYIYNTSGEYNKAMYLYNEMYNCSLLLKDTTRQLNSMTLMAEYYMSIGYDYKATTKLIECIELANLINNDICAAEAYINLGDIYTKLKKYEESNKYLFDAMDIFAKHKDEAMLAAIYQNIAGNFQSMKMLDSALYFSNIALDLIEQTGEVIFKPSIYTGKGQILFELKQYDKALFWITKALELDKLIDNKEKICIDKTYIAKIFLETKTNLSSAKEHLEDAQKIAEELNSFNQMIEVYQTFAEYYELTCEPQKALEYIRLYARYKDSITNRERTHELGFLQGKYEAQIEYDELMKNDEKNKQLQIMIVIVSITLGLFAGGFFFILYFVSKRNQKKLKEVIASKDKFFSIIAHDLRNPLGAFKLVLNTMVKDGENLSSEERNEFFVLLEESANNLYYLLENLLEWSKSQRGITQPNIEEVHLESMVNNVFQLLSQNAENKKIKLIKEINNEIVVKADFNMLITIVRNLVSNSIKFSPAGKNITVSAFEQNSNIIISIIDEGVGMTQEFIDKVFDITKKTSTIGTSGEIGSGLGLILCKELCEKNNGKLEVASRKNIGTTFNIILPN